MDDSVFWKKVADFREAGYGSIGPIKLLYYPTVAYFDPKEGRYTKESLRGQKVYSEFHDWCKRNYSRVLRSLNLAEVQQARRQIMQHYLDVSDDLRRNEVDSFVQDCLSKIATEWTQTLDWKTNRLENFNGDFDALMLDIDDTRYREGRKELLRTKQKELETMRARQTGGSSTNTHNTPSKQTGRQTQENQSLSDFLSQIDNEEA